MRATSWGWISRVGATLGGAWMLAGCGAYTVTDTGGAVFQQSAAVPDPLSAALSKSASRDLPCESEPLDVQRLESEREYVVTGCGKRVSYRALTPTLTSKRLELVTSSPWPPARDVALLKPALASSGHSAP